MNLESIGSELKAAIASNTGQNAGLRALHSVTLLRISGDAFLNYLRYSNDKLGMNSDGYISQEYIERIDSLFRELNDNFFAMAHSNEPLQDLRIIELRKLRLAQDMANALADRMEESVRMLEVVVNNLQDN
jgi:hypothetical protein